MPRSKFRTLPVRNDNGGEHRLQMLTSTGLYQTIAHFTDAAMSRNIVKLLNKRDVKRTTQHGDGQDQMQRELLSVEHKGLHPRRLKSYKHDNYVTPPNSEAFYAALWREWNDGRMSVSTKNVLHFILCPEALQDKGHQTIAYSRRDAQVAATVIQWLGTNVGRSFVIEAEERNCESHRAAATGRRRASPPTSWRRPAHWRCRAPQEHTHQDTQAAVSSCKGSQMITRNGNKSIALMAEVVAVLARYPGLRCAPIVDQDDGLLSLSITVDVDDLQVVSMGHELKYVADVATMRYITREYDIDAAKLEALLPLLTADDAPRSCLTARELEAVIDALHRYQLEDSSKESQLEQSFVESALPKLVDLARALGGV